MCCFVINVLREMICLCYISFRHDEQLILHMQGGLSAVENGAGKPAPRAGFPALYCATQWEKKRHKCCCFFSELCPVTFQLDKDHLKLLNKPGHIRMSCCQSPPVVIYSLEALQQTLILKFHPWAIRDRSSYYGWGSKHKDTMCCWHGHPVNFIHSFVHSSINAPL